MSGPIDYPNRIEDHHTVVKLREMIDGHNQVKAATDENTKMLGSHQATIDALPTTYMTAQGTVNQIGMYISTPTFLTGLNTALVKLGFTVPTPPTQVAAALPAPRMAGVRLSGNRVDAPQNLTRTSAGLLFYCTDYAHLCMWDGNAWQLADTGGYLVMSEIELGIGWVECNGQATDYLLNDTPDLAVRGYITRRHRSLSRHLKQYFRR
jgi:hypothetical protein